MESDVECALLECYEIAFQASVILPLAAISREACTLSKLTVCDVLGPWQRPKTGA